MDAFLREISSSKDKSSSEDSETQEINSEEEEILLEEDANYDMWVYEDCCKPLNNNTTGRQIICDNRKCNNSYMLQCSGIIYEDSAYYDLDLENINFICERCREWTENFIFFVIKNIFWR